MGKVPKNSEKYEESQWQCSVRRLTDMLVVAAGIIGWCPVSYIPWAFSSVALVAFILSLLFQTRTLEHISVYIVQLMAPLQLVIVASLLPLLCTRVQEYQSALLLPVSPNATDTLF